MKIRIKEDEVTSALSQIKTQMSAFMGGMEDALEDTSKNQKESVVLTTASLLLALPAILGLIARLGKTMSSIIKRTIGTASQNQNDTEKYFQQMGRIADELHHLYIKPIELIVRRFVKDPNKASKVATGIFHVIVAIMMIASGVGAVKALKANSINMATLETALTAVKGGEVKTYLSKLIS
jgi:Flp pilus assembly pilin Flp